MPHPHYPLYPSYQELHMFAERLGVSISQQELSRLARKAVSTNTVDAFNEYLRRILEIIQSDQLDLISAEEEADFKTFFESAKGNPDENRSVINSDEAKVANQQHDIVALLLTAPTLDTDTTITDQNGMSALMFASEKGDSISVELLLQKMTREAINAQNKNGWTALMHAARYGHTGIVAQLLAKGADTELQENDGWTAPQFAESAGHEEIVRLLLDAR